MILIQSKIKIFDNSGAKQSRIISHRAAQLKQRVFNQSTIKVGSIVKLSIIKYKSNKKIKHKQLYLGLIVTSAKKVQRKNGSSIKFDQSRSVILNNTLEPLGSRIITPIVKELKLFSKIRILANGTV